RTERTRGQFGVGQLEVGVVEEIEELSTDLQPARFKPGNLESLGDIEIEISEVRTIELVPALLAKVGCRSEVRSEIAGRKRVTAAAAMMIEVVVELCCERHCAVDHVSSVIGDRERIATVVEYRTRKIPIARNRPEPVIVRTRDRVVSADVVTRVVVGIAVVLRQIIRIDLAHWIYAKGIETAVRRRVEGVAVGVVELHT